MSERPATKPIPPKAVYSSFILFLAPFCAVGLWASVQLIRAIAQASWSQAGMFSIVALAFGGVGFGMLIAVKKVREEERLKIQYPDQPWMWKSDWTSGRIRCSFSCGKTPKGSHLQQSVPALMVRGHLAPDLPEGPFE